MPEETLQPCAYHVVRYQPNLIRDEWVNIGVLFLDPATGRVRQRWLEEAADLARLRRLHPAADEELLLRLPAEFDRQFAGREMDSEAILEKFDETLSNALQLSPRKGVLAGDADAALDRIFREQVEPGRDPGQAKLLAFSADAIRGGLAHAEFLAVTEREPAGANERDKFVTAVLADKGIRVLPLAGLRKWAHEVAPALKAG